ncbi:MAG: DUF2061 domain-containing protein [Flavobacteriaceae bacterium]|nr:DUF2061 domain-containing protein [Flavobacteriaceae bacterium]
MSLHLKSIRDSTDGETKRRSAAKSITWRILASIDTAIISYVLTGSFKIAISIGVIENIVKIVIYFFHERAWNLVKWGKSINGSDKDKPEDIKSRSIVKAISWSFVGALTTIAIAYALSIPIKTSILIGVIEVFTRFLFYFLHERLWNKIKWGKRVSDHGMEREENKKSFKKEH